MDREALNQLSKDELIALLLAQDARIAELAHLIHVHSIDSLVGMVQGTENVY